jgi:hypothetical protein
MKKYLTLIFVFALLACEDEKEEKEEQYPIEPAITFSKIDFIDVPNQLYDTLKLTFTFTDGDMDFGLDHNIEAHREFPYQPYYYFLKSTGEKIPSDKLDRNEVSTDQLIQFSDRKNPPYDTLPESGSCHYRSVDIDGGFVQLYSLLNEDFFNLDVDFIVNQPNGSFSEFDWFEQFCQTFNGRVLSGPGKSGPFLVKMKNKQRGEIAYSMISTGFTQVFGDKTLKLQITIKDRALHTSNKIQTPEFRLRDI